MNSVTYSLRMGRKKLKRHRQATSEDNIEEETEIQDPVNLTATPKSPRDTESTVRTSTNTTTDMMLRNIWEKVSVLDDISTKINTISERMSSIETRFESMDTRIHDVENATEYLETEMGEIKEEIQNIRASKASYEYVNEIRRGVVDLVNRSKQNNVILHGIPEGEEGATNDCVTFAKEFFKTHLHMNDVEIERAHRTPRVHRAEQRSGEQPQPKQKPRPIHVKLLRFTDREAILKQSSKLRDVTIKGSRVGISDDVHKDTRNDHKRLMIKVKELRAQNKFAFIPNSVPRVIKYKDGPKDSPGSLKTIRVTDLDNSAVKMI